MRSGFTLIELVIVMVLIGFGTVLMLTSYQASQNRLRFHLQASDLQSSLDLARASSHNAGVETDKDRLVIVNIDPEAADTIYSFIDTNSNEAYEADTDILLKEVTLKAEDIELRDARVFTSEAGGGWDRVVPTQITIKYTPPEASCDFTQFGDEYEEYMLEIPLYKPGNEEATRYIYLHKVACLSELLSSQLE